MIHGSVYLDQWGVTDPKMVGASEYHAIHELLTDALTGCDEDVADAPEEFAQTVLDELIGHAVALKKLIKEATKR